MGKKSRNKKRRDKGQRIPVDEVFSSGPLKIERFGRFIRLSNDSTPEQHATFLVRVRESHARTIGELERELAELQNLIPKYDPVRLLHRAAYMLLPLFMKYRSENEYSSDESYFLPAVEYLQYLVARTEANTDGHEPTETEWNEIWNKTLGVIHLTQSYLMTRKTSKTPPDAIDQLRFMIDMRRLLLRVNRYPVFFSEYIHSSLAPYDRNIREIYGVGIDEIASGLIKIAEYLKSGVLDRYWQWMEATKALQARLESFGFHVSDANVRGSAPPRELLESPDVKPLFERVQETGRSALTPEILEITIISGLPKSFLHLLSVAPGESILRKLTGPDHDDLSPLSTSVIHAKPFLESAGRFYSFYHSGFEDHIDEIVESELFRLRPGQVSAMAKARSDSLESRAKELLSRIIGFDFAHQNAFYPNPDDVGNLTELDILLGVDDILFLVEVKAGSISAAAARGAPKSIAQELSDLIIEGQRQSERAERYIKSAPEVPFFDETGKTDLLRLRAANFRKIIRVVVTREDLGWVGARIAILSILDPKLNSSFPWHVSIDDLVVVAELFKGEPVRFIHYLELRLLASAEKALIQHDEIEHVALYNAFNFYHELPVDGMDKMTFDPSYMRGIDHYFAALASGQSEERPTQRMPIEIRDLIVALGTCALNHRFEAGCAVLSLNETARQKLAAELREMDQRLRIGRARTIRLPLIGMNAGISVTYANSGNWEEEQRQSSIQMKIAGVKRWIAVELAQATFRRISDIKIIDSTTFGDDELADASRRHELKTLERIKHMKPGRNDVCPCGSGKKFKKCHGR